MHSLKDHSSCCVQKITWRGRRRGGQGWKQGDPGRRLLQWSRRELMVAQTLVVVIGLVRSRFSLDFKR